MRTPSPDQLAVAAKLLSYEAGAEGGAGAAARVYEKLHLQLAPIVGAAGVQALFMRSARVMKDEFPCLGEPTTVATASGLRECLRDLEPGAVAATAAGLFGAFLALIATFIGKRLTTEMLRRAWPEIDEPTPEET